MPFEFPQTTMTQFCDPAVEGMIADLSAVAGYNTASYVAIVAMNWGRGVVLGAAHDEIKLPTSAADITDHFQGFTRYEAMRTPVIGGNAYAIKAAVPVLRRGPIWLLVEGAATVDDGPVYIVNGSGAGTPGRLRGDANGGAATLVARAKVRQGAAPGALSKVEINLV